MTPTRLLRDGRETGLIRKPGSGRRPFGLIAAGSAMLRQAPSATSLKYDQ